MHTNSVIPTRIRKAIHFNQKRLPSFNFLLFFYITSLYSEIKYLNKILRVLEGIDQKENYNWCRFCRQGWVATKIIAPLRIYQRFRYTINLVGEPYILCPFLCSRTTSITRKGLVMVVNSMYKNGLSDGSINFLIMLQHKLMSYLFYITNSKML